ncbi:MAG: M23 family metallopeptidase [Candidatus Melainabacteria bacterium]|nr:M23 family metallopeptidase [Candidatus Melainabacteria bacterium]
MSQPPSILLGLIFILSLAVFAQQSWMCASGPGKPNKQQVSPTVRQAGDMRPVLPQSWAVVAANGQPLSPIAMVAIGDDIFFLDPKSIWRVAGGKTMLSYPQPLRATAVVPLDMKHAKVPVHELANFVSCPNQGKLVILDKSGDLFELSVANCSWAVLRANYSATSSPDPEFIDLACAEDGICVLDPERNQIWKFVHSHVSSQRYFPEVLPWRIKPGDINVADGVSIASDGDTYVLKRNGNIGKYNYAPGLSKQERFSWARLAHMRPSRIVTGPAMPLYVVERENNRVVAIDKATGRSWQFVFSANSDLRGLLPAAKGFWIINKGRVVYKSLNEGQTSSVGALYPRRIDGRLDGMILPIKGVCLPRHPGVWPGARRLYRFGVHKGMDFFADPACHTSVVMDTPVCASDAGKVIRADVNFADMDSQTFARVMTECRKAHDTSPQNEDLFRGRQVWVDHGNGVITRYAHLNNIQQGILTGSYVSRGEVIGYVGVSGTGESLPGHVKHPHLHFEIWLDGNYLGFGLTSGETIGLYEDIFGTNGR